ncbi:hypothetical protein [Methanococcoides burtonii]|uniref:hypothetical protein n=1 Tax=Methanococcoides burtonii TaxID=29291 RepID=UPI0000541BB7|nr:hypothetical protein [Methanococcoides burtonii]
MISTKVEHLLLIKSHYRSLANNFVCLKSKRFFSKELYPKKCYCLAIQMETEKLFYKYLKFKADDENHTIDNLTKNQLYFSDSTKFNDPFDCKVNLVYQGKIEDWDNLLIRKGFRPNKSNEIKSPYIEKDGDLFTFDPMNEVYHSKHKTVLHGGINKKHLPRVCCFSETNNRELRLTADFFQSKYFQLKF